AGPDALGQALGLASVLAFLDRRPRLGGVLASLAILARPELVLVALAATAVCMSQRELRPPTRRALWTGAISLALLVGVLRPPLESPSPASVLLAALAAASAGGAFVISTRAGPRIRLSLIIGGVLGLAALGTLSGAGSFRHWAENDWPLLLAGLAGCVFGARTPRFRVHVQAIVLAGALLAFVYTLKNPGADRYLALLTPLVALLASFATAVLARPHHRVVAVGVAGLIAITLVLPRLAPRSADAFPTVASQLEALNLPRFPFVTTAPDAYGVLLPNRSVVAARPGAHGLIIDDGAQRAYSPSLRIEGRTLATLDPGAGFVRPDGVTDRQPVRVVLGTITG